MSGDETVLWELSADPTSVVDAFDEIDASVQQSSESIAQFSASASDLSVFDDILSAIQELTANVSAGFTDLASTLDGVDASIGEVTSAVDGLSAAMAEAATSEGELAAGGTAAEEELGLLPGLLENVSGALEGLQAAAGPLMMIATAAGMAGGAIFNMGTQAQASFSLAQNMGGATAAGMQNLEQKAVQLGVGMKEAGDGMYFVASYGFKGKDAITVLTDAIEGAKGSGSQFKDIAVGLGSSLNAYGASADQAGNYTDMMVKTIKQGAQTASDYASAIGPLASAAHLTGVSFAEVNAAEATMTSKNPHVRQDAQQLTALMNAMGTNVDAVAASAKKMGLSFDENTYKSDNFAQRLEYLRTVTHGNMTDFTKLVGGTNGLKAASYIMDMSSGSMKMYADNLDAIGHSAGTTKQEFDASEQTVQAGLDHISAAFSLFALKAVTELGPKLMPMFDGIAKGIEAFTDLIVNHTQAAMPILAGLATMLGVTLVAAVAAFIIPMLPIIGIITGIGVAVAGLVYVIQHWGDITAYVRERWESLVTSAEDLVNRITSFFTSGFHSVVDTVEHDIASILSWFNQWKGVILGVGGTITAFFLPALIKAGVQAVVSGAQIASSFIKSLIESGTASVVNGAKTSASFVTSMIQTGTEAVINGAKVTVSFIGSMIRTGVEAVINGAKVTISFVKSLIQTGIEGWASAGKLATFIGSMIATGAQAVINGAKVAISFVGSMITAGAQAVATGARVVVSFVGSMITAGAQAVISGARIAASFILSIVQAGAASVVAGAQMLAALVPAFLSWAAGALAAAAATIAATWPILVIIGAIALLALGIYELVTHWRQVTSFLQTTWKAFSGWFENALSSVKNFFVQLWNSIANWFQSNWQHIIAIARDAAMVLLAVVLGPTGILIDLIISHWSQVVAFLRTAWATITGDARSAWNAVTGVFRNAWSGISSALSGLWSNISNWFRNLTANALHWGQELIQNLISGISSQLGNLGNMASNIAGTISKFIHFTKPDTGPLADIDKYMPDMGDLLAKGLNDQVGKLSAASKQVAHSIAQVNGPSSAATNTGAGGAGNSSLATSLLSQLVALMQQQMQNQQRQGGTNASTPISTKLGTVVTQYNNNNFNGVQNIASIYQQIATLAGLSVEGGLRGTGGGLGV